MTPKQRLNILLADDGSQHAQAAVERLQNISLPPKSQVLVFRAFHSGQIPYTVHDGALLRDVANWLCVYSTQEQEEAIRKKEAKSGEMLLARTCGLLQRQAIDSTPVLARGDAATEILNHVRNNKIDLLVAGSRGLSQIESLWMGSVSRKLVHYSDCSVLVVKGPRKE